MKWYEQPTIPLDQTINRGVYELQSRNLVVGVYRADTKGFIGIREKLLSVSLFEEYHYDTGAPLGTARPLRLLGMLPDDVELKQAEPIRCSACQQELAFRPDVPGQRIPGTWRHVADGSPLCQGAIPGASIYRPLLEFLQPLTDQALARYAEEED